MTVAAAAWYGACILGAFIWIVGSDALISILSLPEAAAAAVVVGTVGPAYVAFLVAAALSMLEPQTLILTNVLLLWLVLERLPRFGANLRASLAALRAAGGGIGGAADAAVAGALVLAAAIFLGPLYSSRMIPEDEQGNIYSGGSCWADLPIHMCVAQRRRRRRL